MLTSAPLVAFVPSSDLDRSRAFYEDVLGLAVSHLDGFAVVIQTDAVTVRITNVGPTLRVQPFTVLGWEVADVHAQVAELTARGVEFLRPEGLDGLDEAGVWTTPDGSQVAWFQDPDGNTLSVDHHGPLGVQGTTAGGDALRCDQGVTSR
jgi:catechol 2,3-dioxygenase-like lactoylglutathione lyase family enzyme